MIRESPITDEIYHIYNRGVEKRKIFMNDKDYFRFLHSLWEFNDENPSSHLEFHFNRSPTGEVGLRQFKEKKSLVNILAFCLMPNHYHLMIRQLSDGGITKFMRKIGTGYTNYFNLKYKRVGSLFQNKYKLKILRAESHFLYLPHYIHLNPLGLTRDKSSSNEKFNNLEEKIKFLESYRWSSLPDYLGEKNFPSIIQKEFLNGIIGDPKEHRKELIDWIKDSSMDEIEHIAIDNLS